MSASPMTRIDFYVLAQNREEDRYRFAARLCEKVLHQGLRVQLIAADAEQAQQLDSWLWQFRPESFVPHALSPAGPEVPVVISAGDDWQAPASPSDQRDLLINLAPTVPTGFARFPRLAEIVIQVPDVLTSTRHNFRHFKEQGYAIQTHNLG